MIKEMINITIDSAVNWREMAMITWHKSNKHERLSCYVFSHDGLWYLQAPPERTNHGKFMNGVVFGFETHRKGFTYKLVAISSMSALPPVLVDLPSFLPQSPIVEVTRKS